MNTFIGTAMKGQRRSKEAKWVGQKGDLKPKTKAPFLEPDLYDYEGKHFVNVCTIMKMKKRLLENLDLQYMHTYLYIHICMSMSEYEHVWIFVYYYISIYVGAEFDEDEEAANVQKAKEQERSGPLNAVAGFRYDAFYIAFVYLVTND
jgi:hypothetical protein